MRTPRLAVLVVLTSLITAPNSSRAQGTRADYARAESLREITRDKVFKTAVRPHWFANNERFWYRNDLAGGAREFIVVDARRGERRPAFDQAKLADALAKVAGKAIESARLPIDAIVIDSDGAVFFKALDKDWRFNPNDGKLEEAKAPETPQTEPSGPELAARRRSSSPRGNDSPDGKWTTFVRDHKLFIREKDTKAEFPLAEDGTSANGYEPSVFWAPDSAKLVALKTEKGDDRKVHLIESSPRSRLQPTLQSYDYLKPGDKVPVSRPHLYDVSTRQQIRVGEEFAPNPWSVGEVRWDPDSSRFTYLYNQRGHQVLRIVAVDATTGESRAIIEETSPTFIDYSQKMFTRYLDDSVEILWSSERDGWNHLYLYDATTGTVKNRVTNGEWLVRAVDRVDDEARQVWFRAMGIHPGQDPYHVHFARVNLDGTGLVVLTEGDGTHTVEYSPDRKYLIDTYSRVDMPPVIELRSAEDGKLVCELERADASALSSAGMPTPERFVAKGRDAETDIHGMIVRPTTFDPAKKYAVIEAIYAGPQGAFVPKTFSPAQRSQALAELGFIVVHIDGMGTNWRSKAFHDVCWKDLGDAGFPDRILWMKAAAEKYPSLDLTRVGVYGGSAGGQSALGGLLFHPEFYKVAVADCGCHDNRMDKIWWNEAWMGWPIGPEYAASSNVANAHKLRGKLLLTVGELDRNVDPASTMQVVDALIKAKKDFELVVFPGAGHGAGSGPYGQRRLRDFFVRRLLGVQPPDWNSDGDASTASTHVALKPATDAKPSHRRAADLPEVDKEPAEMRNVIERYSADLGSLRRSLPGGASPANRTRMSRFFEARLDALQSLDFDALGRAGRVDYVLLRNQIDHELRRLTSQAREEEETAPLLPFAKVVFDLEEARRRLDPVDAAKTAGVLDELSRAVKEARKVVESARGDRSEENAPRVSRTVANRAAREVEGLRSTLGDWYGFHNNYDPLFTWWSSEPYKAADKALQDYATLLRERLAGVRPADPTTTAVGPRGPGARARVDDGEGGNDFGRGGAGGGGGGRGFGPRAQAEEGGGDIIGDPIGRQALLDELAYALIPYSPEELVEIANTEFAWCDEEMKRASRDMGFGDDWKKALERVKTLHVEPGKQPALIRDLAVEAVKFVDDHDLVTVPELARESWRMEMMSPQRQLVNPFFTGGEVISVSYPTSTMTHEQKLMSMRGNNIHFSRATVHHELIPGHHLQGYMTARYRPYRRPFGTPFWTEGWALYWELLLWDKKFPQSAEDRVGMLFWRMHRCARIIFSLNFHLGKMTPRECIDFLVDRVGHERDNATAEVRRSFAGGYGPLYQSAYLLGGLQIRALRRELVESGKMADRAFHDAILHENSIPIEMVRASLTDQPLTRDYATKWRFYDSTPKTE